MRTHYARRVNPLGLLSTFLLSMAIVPPITLAPGDVWASVKVAAAPSACTTNAECDDGNLCTTDTCDLATGCVYTNNGDPCNDQSACTTGDNCSGGACVGTSLVCADSNFCTEDRCNPATGCVYVNNANACDDGNACTAGDHCEVGTCRSGTPLSCNDSNLCTSDS